MLSLGLVLLCIVSSSAQVDSVKVKSKALDTLEALKFFESKGLKIDSCVNQKLYFEIFKWLNTPYCYGGETGKGIDCSGFSNKIYQTVYGKTWKAVREIFLLKLNPSI